MAGFLSPAFQFEVRQQLSIIQERPFKAFLEGPNSWWQYVAKVIPTRGRKHVINWILQTAYLENLGQSTDLPKRDLTIVDTTFIPDNVGERIEISLNDFKDEDGGGIDTLAGWVEQISMDGAHYPQRTIATLIEAGEAAASAAGTYDANVFFSIDHPLNPVAGKARGTFSNLFTSTASSTPSTDANDAIYPGALPIMGNNFETAFTNLQKAYGYINSIRQANNVQPRFLRPWAIIAPPIMVPRINALLRAKFAAFAANTTNGGGTTDIAGQLQELGYTKVFSAPEMVADATSYYIVAEQIVDSQLGAIAWTEREPIGTQIFWPTDGKNADLARRNVVEAQSRGRMSAGYGKPELIFKAKAT